MFCLWAKSGEGNGTPLQCSNLENPMDGGAWWAAVHGDAKSRTRLSDFTFTFHSHALEKEMATHYSVVAWRILGTGEPGGLLSMGSHRVGYDWSDLAAWTKSLQFCLTLCDARGCSLPGFSVHGILQARILGWIAITSSRESSRTRDWTCVSYVSGIGRWVLYHQHHNVLSLFPRRRDWIGRGSWGPGCWKQFPLRRLEKSALAQKERQAEKGTAPRGRELHYCEVQMLH